MEVKGKGWGGNSLVRGIFVLYALRARRPTRETVRGLKLDIYGITYKWPVYLDVLRFFLGPPGPRILRLDMGWDGGYRWIHGRFEPKKRNLRTLATPGGLGHQIAPDGVNV